MKTTIADVSNYLFNEGIENEINSEINYDLLYINKDSIVANYPTCIEEEAYDALLNDINETFQEKYRYRGRNDDFLYLEQIP